MAGGLRALSVKAVSFGGIGVINTGIHAGIVVLLVETFAVWPPVGHVFGFVAASLFSYFANATITFRMPMSLAGYLKFHLPCAEGYIELKIDCVLRFTSTFPVGCIERFV